MGIGREYVDQILWSTRQEGSSASKGEVVAVDAQTVSGWLHLSSRMRTSSPRGRQPRVCSVVMTSAKIHIGGAESSTPFQTIAAEAPILSENEGNLWPQWVETRRSLRTVSLFCGKRRGKAGSCCLLRTNVSSSELRPSYTLQHKL